MAMKTEPKSTAINPRAVAQIGVHQVNTVPRSIVEGRGYQAPKSADTIHKSGSQGKH